MAISIESLRAVNKCINGKYSRILVSRTLKGNEKQFELARACVINQGRLKDSICHVLKN